jgi:small GTP-binding protein
MSDLHSSKLVCVGDGAVGKTCLLQRYTQNSFPTEYIPTVFENQSKSAVVDEQSVQVEIVDTEGLEGYANRRSMSYG